MLKAYLSSVEKLVHDISLNVEELSYIFPEQIAINFKRSRESSYEEVLAETTGVSNPNFTSIQKKEGRIEKYLASRSVLKEGIPIKYAIDIYIPAFFKLAFREKLLTIFHELYHIHPRFDGELRVFKGRGYKHGSSVERYDKYMEFLMEKYMDKKPITVDFLRSDYKKLNSMVSNYTVPRISRPEASLFRIRWK